MTRAVSERIELLHVGDLAADIVSEAAAAALAKLDELGVSPMRANFSYGQIEVMDDQGDLEGDDPPYEKFGVVLSHVDAYGAATDTVLAVFRGRGVGPRAGGIGITAPEAVWEEFDRSGKDLSAAQ